jgi:CRP-like cAMP-binding protein
VLLVGHAELEIVYDARLPGAYAKPMDPARIAVLQRMPIFGGIRDAVLRILVEQSSTLAVPAGTYFFREHDPAESLFVLEVGRVAILKHRAGQEHLLAHLSAGDCFGEMALMDLFPRSAGVQAVEPCTAVEIAVSSFHRLYESDLEQFAIIQMNLGREVSRRLRAADERLFRLMLGEPAPEAGSLPLPIT